MKLELNVVRMANEDVIATSLCSYINTPDDGYYTHIKVTSLSPVFTKRFDPATGGNLLSYVDDYEWILSDNVIDDVDKLGWYHYDEGLGKYVYCADQRDEAHPVQ